MFSAVSNKCYRWIELDVGELDDLVHMWFFGLDRRLGIGIEV